MRYLLDTHVVLWLLLGRRRSIPEAVAAALTDSMAEPMVSAATVWEIAIKRSLGRLELEDRWLTALLALDLTQLPVSAHHAAEVGALPWHHRDPFDRLLIAQARVEGLVLVSADAAVARYDVPVLW